jgi:hypothetical protein
VTFAYEHGGASLMDFLNAQSDYRQVQLAYAQLLGAYLTAAGQLNLAVGSEAIQERRSYLRESGRRSPKPALHGYSIDHKDGLAL